MDLQEQLKVLTSKEKDIRSQLSEINREIKKVELAICEEKYGVKTGTIVISNNIEFKVTHISPWSHIAPSIKGVKRNKDGNWSTRVQRIYGNWDVKN